MIVERRYTLFGYRFCFRTNYPRAAELLARLYTGQEDTSRDANGDEAGNVYELWHQPGGDHSREWMIHVPGPPAHSKPSFGDAISAVEASIAGDVTRYPHGLHVVHGGVVYAPEGDLLLSGDSGAGKTTLSLALHAQGLQVGGDDVAMLDPVSGAFLPYPRCFHIDARSAQLLAGVGLRLPADLLRTQFVTPADLGMAAAAPARVRFVFLLEPERLTSPRIVPETQAQAVSKLLMQTGRGRFTDLEAVRAIARLTGAARSFRLWSGELGATVEAVLQVVRSVLP
jgi:hypothetical protein